MSIAPASTVRYGLSVLLPVPYAGHRHPWFLRRQGVTGLQQFYRDVVRRTDECHVAITRRSVDCDARVHQLLANGVYVIDPVREMTEVATFIVFFRVPVIGQLHLRCFVTGCRKEYERKPALFALVAPEFDQAQLVAVKLQ